ncbi:hypothetical protein QBC39DRAFT_326748 [Podospora conica]|nr:hypothetical protein QBC39DRAFT_326748 [Schizothecium conicum]
MTMQSYMAPPPIVIEDSLKKSIVFIYSATITERDKGVIRKQLAFQPDFKKYYRLEYFLDNFTITEVTGYLTSDNTSDSGNGSESGSDSDNGNDSDNGSGNGSGSDNGSDSDSSRDHRPDIKYRILKSVEVSDLIPPPYTPPPLPIRYNDGLINPDVNYSYLTKPVYITGRGRRLFGLPVPRYPKYANKASPEPRPRDIRYIHLDISILKSGIVRGNKPISYPLGLYNNNYKFFVDGFKAIPILDIAREILYRRVGAKLAEEGESRPRDYGGTDTSDLYLKDLASLGLKLVRART